jgi:hypothetical protein
MGRKTSKKGHADGQKEGKMEANLENAKKMLAEGF